MLIALTVLACCLLLLLGVLWAWSPGVSTPFLDENGQPLAGSISEKIRVDINGVQQGMFIR
ncbi:MAG: alpha/beta hydrolase, partial [Thermoanaerobaculia bacterium]|nr:alpha/beta hydrolase [Thermoanaerobaculia bacterium]